MTEETPPTDPKAALDNYISGHRQSATSLRNVAAPLNESQLRLGLAQLHEGIAWLAATIRASSPKHDEYHKVRQTHLYEMAAARFRSAADFAMTAIRSTLLANGGALVAILAFLGNSQRVPEGCALWLSFGFFVAGLLSALVTVLMAYRSQSAYGRQEAAGSDKIYFHLIGDAALSKEQDAEETSQMAIGGRWEILGIVSYLVSLALFLAGAVAAMFALSATPPAT